MPKGPKGQKRPADVIGNAVKVMKIATGEDKDTVEDDGKDPAAKSMGKKGGARKGQETDRQAAVRDCEKSGAETMGF